MILETIGHASLLLRDESGEPLLLTDPWLIGSCYWRSWWLQHYPDTDELSELRRTRWCYITHEHPDHFHPPSLRALGKGPCYLAPDLPEEQIATFLRAQGYKAATIPAASWKTLIPGVRLLSLPAANDDSLLIVDTPHAVLINFNDAKPSRAFRANLKRQLDELFPGKSRILLSSYSPASLVNSFFHNGTRQNLRVKAGYVRAVSQACDDLGAEAFIPFASQAVFRRSDSEWANYFKVAFSDLQHNWASSARLLPPYATVDLSESGVRLLHFTPPEVFRSTTELESKIATQEALDDVPLGEEEAKLLERKLRAAIPFLAILFPRGLSFRATGQTGGIHYNPWTFRARSSDYPGDVTFQIPAAVLKDILATGRFGDLGITMSVRVDLNGRFPWLTARLIYVLLFWVTLHDYGHTTGPKAFYRWLRAAWKSRSPRVPSHTG